MVEELQRVYTIPLGKAYEQRRGKRARKAALMVREFLSRHMKAGLEKVRLSGGIGSELFSHGMRKPPRRIKVVVKRDKDGKVQAYLHGEKEKAPKAEKPKEEKKEKVEAKTGEVAKKEEKKKEEKKEKMMPEKKKAEKEWPKKEEI